MNTFPIEELKNLLSYNKATGVLTWKKRTNPSFNARYAGKEAGYVREVQGRLRREITLPDGKNYFAHRLAYALAAGEWPEVVDHINHNSIDNRWKNLRNVTQQENLKNRSLFSNNTSGICGVSFSKTANRWITTIVENGRTIRKRHATKEEAVAHRKQLNSTFLFHPNHGKKK